MSKYNNLLGAIGNTPHIRLSKLFPHHEVYIKLEKQNPGGSLKDRIALAMIEAAEAQGLLPPGGTIIEPTSGNTGAGLAWIGAVKGYRVIIVMPESMSVERRKIVQAYGAELVLTPRELGMKGAIAKAEALCQARKDAWLPQQFNNPANPAIHRQSTAQEIIHDFPEGLDAFISGVGTGGHLSGVGRALKAQYPALRIYAVEPADSPVLSGGLPGAHALQGIGAGFIPDTLDTKVPDRILRITKAAAFAFAQKAAREEGLLAGISTGASLAAVAQTLPDFPQNAKILTINYDTGERYFSVDGLF
jgi:cysteine synthase A